LGENVPEKSIMVTGNTVIDALFESSILVENSENHEIEKP
jgi:UDP-N-acetylglucosamine 2-epimerase (non-hydrolysing)